MQQLYVTFKEERVGKYVDEKYVSVEKTPLGYAAVYNPISEKCVKKNKAQYEWAQYELNDAGEYEERINHRHVWPDGLLYRYEDRNAREAFMKNGYCGLVPDIKQIYDSIPLKDNLKPRIVDNIQRSGFKIVDTVSRYSTSNKL